MKKILAFFGGFLMFFPVYAEDGDSLSRKPHRFGYTVSLSPGQIIVMDSWQQKWQKKKNTFSVSAEINYSAAPQDSDAFARDYNYPIFALGFKFSRNDVTMHRSPDPAWGMAEEVDYDSRLGNIATLYGTFSRPVYRNRRWIFDYMLGAGIGYGKHKYNNYNNIDNELTGSRFLIYFTAGLHATWRFADDWGLMAGIDYYHHSNGALNRPNKGANVFGPVVGLRYMPYDGEFRSYRSSGVQETEGKKRFQKHVYANFTLGVGGKTLNEEWQLTQFQTPPDADDYRTSDFNFYMAYSLQADVMYRYARRWASGLGADLFYGTYADRVRDIESLPQNSTLNTQNSKISPWSFGLALKHQVFYRNLSVTMSLGYYLYRHMGQNAKEIEKPYYERIGLSYTFPSLRGLTLGFNIKAHRTKADLTELTVSYPVAL